MLALTFLGTGTSNGIPVIGCNCDVCTSPDPRDTRSRTSAVVRWDELTILIDTAPELRLQARAAGLDRIDTVLFTHAHADHTGGLDDLRRFNEINQQHLPIYASPTTAEALRERYGYAFVDHFPFYGGKPDLTLHEFTSSIDMDGKMIVVAPVMHGQLEVSGFRFGPLGYITDAKSIPPESMALLEGVEVLVLNGLRERPHPTHLSLGEAVEVSRQIGPRKSYLVHLSHETSHAEATALMPECVEIAYDGLTVTVEP
jgi:phosphoribosyl 1,2-cyclic phosphate phosphodiesterase